MRCTRIPRKSVSCCRAKCCLTSCSWLILPALIILSVDITFRPCGSYLLSSSKIFLCALLVAIVQCVFELQRRASSRKRVEQVHCLFPRAYQLPVSQHQRRIQVAETLFRVGQAGHGHTRPGRIAGQLGCCACYRRVFQPTELQPLWLRSAQYQPGPGKDWRSPFSKWHCETWVDLECTAGDSRKEGVKLPTIVSRLGIPTSCYVNYTLYDNCASVGEVKLSQCRRNGQCYDDDVIPLLEDELDRYVSGSRFVVLHLGGGSHGPVYGDRHPPEFQLLKPMCNDADVANQCTLEQLYNSYDNTILFVDYVLGGVLQALDRSGAPYVFIYLSDHGESLRDEGRMCNQDRRRRPVGGRASRP